ncbi:protein unc-80 homolog isoform X2 [Physella acuta]|uniref:protein unc-80 homolog isoform X2 n=1 Tax=Physella acuta TaxID=109671 RepID=UPI0027DB0F9C|nr:protein unc-80 homolog isoform X2 [Physella acuta]
MVKRKAQSGDDLDGDQSVPLPIQTFFWRQTSPFIRPKQGKLCEASCVSFERVVVQNILHGLSPSLCEAVQSVSRWKVVQASFPHLMHACSSLIAACKKGNPENSFGPSETKLLYTLHWIILDAASECEDADAEFMALRDMKGGSPHMHSLSTVQLFVYLFAPLVHLLKDSDFESLKLENGLRLWQPLWEYQQPDIPCFATPVKPQRSVLRAQRSQLKVNTNAANIYVGKGTSRENLAFLFDDVTSQHSIEEEQTPIAPLARMSDICTLSTADSQTATMEVICENCNTVIPVKSTDGGMVCRCGRKDTLVAFLPDSNNYAFLKLTSAVDKDYVKQKLASAVTSGTRAPGALDILSASYLDVAVLRCLFCLSWSEDGIYWALRYMHQRMLEVCHELENLEAKERARSCSLPIPDLNILMMPSKADPHSMPPTPTAVTADNHSPTIKNVPGLDMRRSAMTTFPLPEVRKEPPFKKIRVVELKQFFDSGKSFLRKRDLTDEGKDDTEGDRPISAMGAFKEQEERLASFSGGCRKSLPTLSQHDKDSMGSSSQCSGQDSSTSSQADLQAKAGQMDKAGLLDKEAVRRPIIRITEHSPETKADEIHGSPLLPRSLTDSNIAYKQDGEIQEVSGSKYYIQPNGHMNYKVVLRALHFVAMNEHAPRICEVLLNLLNCLLDLDIIESASLVNTSPATAGTPASIRTPGQNSFSSASPTVFDTSPKSPSPDDGLGIRARDEVTAHSLAMDSLFRIYKALGCPHGCGDGVVGSQGDHLRIKGQNCLQRLHKMNPTMFHQFLRDTVRKRPLQETVDFLHAFLGFCFDPSTLLQSPMSQKKSVSQENIPRMGYSNNFGHSIGGEGYRGVEGVLIANLVKPLITRCVQCSGELYGNENISLFCDVRQLMAYVKEIHGGTFRRVALSGLLDSLQKVRRESAERKREITLKKEPSPIRRTTSITSESGDETPTSTKHISLQNSDDPIGRRKSRKSLFRTKITKYAASDSEVVDEIPGGKSPRTSISAAEEDSPQSTSTPRRRFSKFNIGWRRGTKSDHEDDQNSDPPPLDRRESRSEAQVHRTAGRGRMSFRAASQATLTFLSARKRIEDGIKGKAGSSDEFYKQRTSHKTEANVELVLVKEKRIVDKFLIHSGMLRFSFLLECCHPGSWPDPQLVAAMLDLEAPVSARAAVLLECAHFIHRCNRGDWPNWMKLNLPSFRHTVAALQNRGQPSGYRRNLMLQRAAGRMFYSWAENLGLQMEYILAREHADRLAVIDEVKDENRKKELRQEDEEEDFLDEACVNQKGKECPYALKMLACLVLVEITTFLRETFQYLPRSRSHKREHLWDKNASSRRYSSIVSSPGHSDKSSESNLAELPSGFSNIGSPGDRKISFAVLTERSDSLHSSTTSLSALDPNATPEEKKERGRRLAQGRQKLLRHFRRGSGHNLSFRRSFKLARSDGGGSMKHGGSMKSRKISSHSLQSDGKFVEEEAPTEDTESVAMMSDDTQESPIDKDMELEDEHLYTNLPWIKVVVQLANLSNFICTHQNFCHPNCYERQRRSCSRLTAAIRKIYESTEEDERDINKQMDKKDLFKEKLKRRESIFQVTSPASRRRESTPLLEKIKTDVSLTKLKLSTKKDEKPKEAKEDPPIIKYLTSQAQRLTQCPMAILTKAAPVLNVEHFIDIMPVAWELMLESDQELAAAAASVFLLSSAKSSDKARNMIIKELQHEETSQRINAVLRFGALWKFRYQVWPRMEEGANMYFKLPPPSIDFTLPSPTIGLPNLIVVDPPWMPHFKTNIEEVTVNQEETKSLVTATTTRRKQQQEMIRKALLAEEERKRVGRENFPMTTMPITQLAAYEPSLHHGDEGHEEACCVHCLLDTTPVVQEEMTLAARRVSLAPTNRANNQSRSMSWRNGSLHWGRIAWEGDEDRMEHGHHLQTAQSVFPSCICAAVLPVLHLLDDHDVNADGVSVAEVANKVIWDCIVDDPILFLRHFLEKLTVKDRQEELMFLLRKLILYFPQMPAQAAHSIFNYLIGYIMFYVRTPCEGGQDAISGALSLLWLCIPSVEGIYFKDLKQTLKKEQCDPYLLVSASVASAKKILVHGPDLSSIPSQLPIHEDTQFYQILQESLEFFNIPENQHDSHFLVDTKTHQIHSSNAYVRDFYFFRRNFYPQLSLVHMNPQDAALALQRRVFLLKFIEVGKVLLTQAVMKCTPPHQLQNHVSFLHEELSKLPSFPRKALESEFDMYSGVWGKEIFGMDSLHKYSWAKLMRTVFNSMSSTFTWSNDLNLFINVLNGTIVLQFEDTAILRFCLATLINASRHFKHIFATNGFLYIMPTLLRVYSNNQPNPVLKQAIHFVCKQFYILHRKPFILQLFGSVAAILDMTCAAGGVKNCTKVQPSSLFNLLLALEKDCPDHLSVLDLVMGDKPLKALDFCYENDPDTFNMMDVVNMCVTVIAYTPDSFRSGQMLTILEMVIPRYLDHLKKETVRRDNSAAARNEVTCITSLAVAVRALVTCCEYFARSMSLPQRFLDLTSVSGSKPVHNHSIHSLTVDEREDSHTSRHMEEGRRKTYGHEPDDLELREDFRKPRDSLLSIAAEFYTRCQSRLKELRKILADPSFRPPELFDIKAHNRLAEVAHTLLKLAPYDPLTMSCTGLQRYMLEILPNTDWSHELIRPGLNLILRRLDRLFTKISKKSALRRQLDWEAAANILKGVYQTLRKFTFVAIFPHLKTLVNVLITILLTSSGSSALLPESLTIPAHRTEASRTDASPLFVSSVVKLVAMQMQAHGDPYSLEQICGGVSAFSANEKSLNLLINFILPLCIRVGSHCRDTPQLSPTDITFVLMVITNLLSPPSSSQTNQNSVIKSNYLSIAEYGRTSGTSHSEKNSKYASELHHYTALVGLEIMMVCFDKQLASQWHQVAKTLINLASKGKVDLPLWKFLDFLVTHRPSLFVLLQTFIQFRMLRINCDTAQEYYLQQSIKDKLQGYTFSYHKPASAILVSLSLELRQLRLELANSSAGYRSRAATEDQTQTGANASMTEIAAEIIGPTKASYGSLIKRSSKATLLSQSSSNSAQQRSQATAASNENSPSLQRTKSSKRITARGGSCILDKFTRKDTVDEAVDIVTPNSPLLQRQGTIRFRGSLSKQNSQEVDGPVAQVVYENEDLEANGRAAMACEAATTLGEDPRGHRLQRQDAKSRKTFKIKRTKTKTCVRPRFMSHRRRPHDVNDADGGVDDPLSHGISGSHGNNFQLRQGIPGMARSVETIPESVEIKSARNRFLQRSKSHDEPSESPPQQREKTSASMRAGRIHRQGGRIVHSRSPSVSPSVSPRPSYHRKKGQKENSDHLDNQTDNKDEITEKNVGQRLAASEKKHAESAGTHSSDWHKFPGSHIKSSAPLSPSSLDGSHANRSNADSSVSFSSLETVISPFGEKTPEFSPSTGKGHENKESESARQKPDTPTRRTAIKVSREQAMKLGAMSPTRDARLTSPDQVKTSPGEAASPFKPGKVSPFFRDQKPKEKQEGRKMAASQLSPTEPASCQHKWYQPVDRSTSPSQRSPLSSPIRNPSLSGSSSQTSPSHLTSFSSSPNDSPIRKPSFSSSQTSPTRKVSYSSSSTTDSPTHKLFFSYRNSPSHRVGYTSPQDSVQRNTSFSSSSHESPVRKPSFSSSSDSRNKPTYSSTTSSQSSILSSPTHVPMYGALSPDHSPTRSCGLPQASPEETFRPAQGSTHIFKYGRPLSPRSNNLNEFPTPDVYKDSALPLKPSSLNLRDSRVVCQGTAPSSKVTSQGTAPSCKITSQGTSSLRSTEAPKHQAGVQSLVSRFEANPGMAAGNYNRSGGPQNYTASESCGSLQSQCLSPPAYTYPSPPSRSQMSTSSEARSLHYTDSHVYNDASFHNNYAYRLDDSPHSHPSSPYRLDDSPHSHPSSPYRLDDSPHSHPSSPAASTVYVASPAASTVYVASPVYVARCDSSDSLSANESSSLLRDEEKSQSLSSLYYADEDIPDAL